MKSYIYVLAFLISGISFSLQAQTATAVMQAKVKIVSGAGLTSVSESVIDLSKIDFRKTNNIKAGSFSLIAAPGTDVNVTITENNSLINEEGETINLEALTIEKISKENGEHTVSLNGTVNNAENLKGNYNGQITAVVEYL